ncbi:hypothetical protein LXL04_001938 [Taraxacum kok-saghyz]
MRSVVSFPIAASSGGEEYRIRSNGGRILITRYFVRFNGGGAETSSHESRDRHFVLEIPQRRHRDHRNGDRVDGFIEWNKGYGGLNSCDCWVEQ